jgi:hypothetical protein
MIYKKSKLVDPLRKCLKVFAKILSEENVSEFKKVSTDLASVAGSLG